MIKTNKVMNMICNFDKKKKCFFLSYNRILANNTVIEDVSIYTVAQSKEIVAFATSMKETNTDRSKLFKLENVIFDVMSKAKHDLRKISVRHKDASCKNSYSDIVHKSFAKSFAENNISNLFFADSENAKKYVIAENRVNETEKKFSVYAIEKMLLEKKSKKTKVVKIKAKSKKSKVVKTKKVKA